MQDKRDSEKSRLQEEQELLQQLVQKGKRGFLRAIFGRTTVVIVLLVLQILLLLMNFLIVEKYVPLYLGGMTTVGAAMLIYLLNTPGDPTVKLTWAFVIAMSPIPGTLFYWFVQMDIGHRREQRVLAQMEREAKDYYPDQDPLMSRLKKQDPALHQLATYMEKCGGFPVYEHTAVKYFPLGEDKFAELLVQIRKAERFVFLEYFAIDKGELWTELLELLADKARQGVEVRLLYDGTCSISALPHDYPQQLAKLGIQCKSFAPIRPLVTTRYNNRDHRKICVIDGKVGFTGGVNLADEYINRKVVYGHWKDTAVMLQGEAVTSLTLLFLQMWNATEAQRVYDPYLLPPEENRVDSPGYVLPYGDSPLDDELVGEMVYRDILNRAKDYVYIMTPYLILDHEMITALSYAAKRGVEVKLILPHIPDKPYAFVLAKSHYKELTRAGVQIYEYTPGFVHAKVFLSDDSRAVVGTINLDYRSLYLHFECAAYLQDVPAIGDIKADFCDTLAKCQPVTPETIQKEKLSVRMAGALLKVIAPLM